MYNFLIFILAFLCFDIAASEKNTFQRIVDEHADYKLVVNKHELCLRISEIIEATRDTSLKAQLQKNNYAGMTLQQQYQSMVERCKKAVTAKYAWTEKKPLIKQSTAWKNVNDSSDEEELVGFFGEMEGFSEAKKEQNKAIGSWDEEDVVSSDVDDK